MPRRTRRVLPLLLTPLLALALTSCGDDDGGSGSDSSSAALDSVTITGDVGEAPTVEWDGKIETDEIASEVVTEGDGAEVESGDQVFAHIWIGNGYTQEEAFSTYEAKKPELLTVDEEQLSEVFLEGVEGHTLGSRVAVAAPAEDAFGEQGNAQLGIGNKDTVLIVLDLMEDLPDGPEGEEQNAPSWAPDIVEEDGDVTSLDMSTAPEPDGKLREATLIKGTGAEVKSGQTLYVNYLGQTYTSDEPFDESYSGAAASFPIGVGQVVPGWDKTLVGETVGSRVILAIPPEDGYGKAGNPDAGIKGTDTLYFVVDILGAA